MVRDRVSFSLEKDDGDAVEQRQGAIARDGVVDEAKGGKDAITRTRTAPEDEQAPVAVDLLIPHVDEEDEETLIAESTTPLTQQAPVVKVTENPPMEDEGKGLVDKFFSCTICSRLLFKPFVLGCGHLYCDDCLLKAMNIAGESTCAMCRRPYVHFPAECKLIGILVKTIVEGGSKGNKILGDKVQLGDITCDVCKEILCEPSVLTCGHVLCISCLTVGGDKIKCPNCSTVHSNVHPVVCLYLKDFIKTCFPEAYKSRLQKVQKSSGTPFLKYNGQNRNIKLSRTHVGVGCDSCGVYPIQGHRFTCKTCENFDLCGKCVKNSSIQGRFGQQHSPDHVLELDDSFLFSKVLHFWNEKNEHDEAELQLLEEGEEEPQSPDWQSSDDELESFAGDEQDDQLSPL